MTVEAAAIAAFGVVFTLLCMFVAVAAWCDARHVAALRAEPLGGCEFGRVGVDSTHAPEHTQPRPDADPGHRGRPARREPEDGHEVGACWEAGVGADVGRAQTVPGV